MTNFVITLKWVLLVITLVRVNAEDTHGIEKRDTNGEAKKIVCYYTNWSVYRQGTAKFTPQNINPYLCTHLIYAFGGLDKENDGLRPFDSYQDIEQGGYAKFNGLKSYNKNLKTLLAIGGWNEGSSRFSKLVADEDRRSTFVKNVVKFLRQNNFDGLDLDWEYPAFRDGSKAADKENYAALVKELRDEFERESSKTGRPRLLLTMAVPAGIEYIDKGYDVPKLNKYLDFMNILSYDYHSVYESKVNHHSPLYALREETEYDYGSQLSIDQTIKHFLKKGASQEKLVLGIPTYGRSFTLLNDESTDLESPAEGPGKKGEATKEKGYLAYYEICASITKDDWTVVQPKKSAMGPYAYHENQWVGYDDIDSVKLKSKYVNEKGLGGIMFWAIDIDDFRGKCHGKPYPLIEAGKEALLASNGKSSNAIATTTDKKRTKLTTRKDRLKESASAKQRTVTTLESPPDSEPAEDTNGKQSAEGDSKKLVCYHTNWSGRRSGVGRFTPDNLNPNLCTHLIYAFAAPDVEKDTIVPTDESEDIDRGGYTKFTDLKTKNKNLKTLLAIGGWNEGSSRFSKLAASKSKRTAFARNVAKFLRLNDFDGLDINWQYPTFRDGDADDKENFVLLIKDLKDEFVKESSRSGGKPRLLLTVALPAGINYINKGFDVAKLNKYLDFMNVLTYDYHSGSDPTVYHHSPLYPLPDQSVYESDLTINHTINHLLKNGADPAKLVLGIPTYGRSYTLMETENTDLGSSANGRGQQGKFTKEDGYLAYYEICSNLAKDDWTVVHPNKSAMGPYAYRGNQWVGYEDMDSVKLKTKYVNMRGLGGIMFWAADIDDFKGECHNKPYPLIEAGKEVLFDSTASASDPETIISAESARPKKSTTTTTTPSSYTISTPEPPTTPDAGADFTCEEDGFFPHPRDCKKYFWCLDSGPSNLGIVAHQFTCPAGLMFNKATDSCDYSRNVICNKKSSEKSTTTTTAATTPKTKSTTSNSKQTSTTTTTTTTTTTEAPEEEVEEEEENVEEDPKAIKQLITLIKKLGGINELERQLKLDDGSKEVTTPAISKNLYNKVFSNPNSNRFRGQHRNAPSGPQNEGLSTTDDVPYRKEKPQYVTIQRSRPKSYVATDAEDSGTTNNKAVRPNKDTTEYAESGEEEEVTTAKYSPSRSRTTQRYVVLERHRPERITTEQEDLAEAESPSSTTQRYITLVRNRPSTVANEIEDLTTETSTQRVTRPVFRGTSTELTTVDKPREKVSEPDATTTAQTLSVTSAQNFTTQMQSSSTTDVGNSSTTHEPTTTNHPKTFIVFAQKVIEENETVANSSTESLNASSTEAFTSSTVTTVISTIRESATEKTRIPLKMYREFVKKNRTDSRHDLATNLVNEPFKGKEVRSASVALKTKTTTEATTSRHGFFRGRKSSTATTPQDSANQTDSLSAEQSSTNSRFFPRRKHVYISNSTTALPHVDNSTEEQNSTTVKYINKLRSSSAEALANLDNIIKRRRASSTTADTASESVSTTSNPFSRSHSRYFSKNKKHSDDPSSTENSSTTHKSRFSKDKFRDHRKSVKSDGAPEATTFSDQISQSNSNEEEIDLDVTEKAEPHSYRRSTLTSAETTTRKYALADHFRHKSHHLNTSSTTIEPSTKSHSEGSTPRSMLIDHFRHWARTTIGNTSLESSPTTTLRPSAETSQTEEHEESRKVEETFTSRYSSSSAPVSETYSRINPRNNSRFLKNPEPAYKFQEQQRKKDPFRIHVTSPSKNDSPVFVIQRPAENQAAIGFEVQIRHENEAARTRSREKVNTENPVSLQRGRKKFSDSIDEEAGNAASFVVDDQRSNRVEKNSLLEGRRSRTHYSSPSPTSGRPDVGETSTRRAANPAQFRNRGSVKAQNSLSKAEIKELTNLVDTSPAKGAFSRQRRPINKIEETYYDVTPKFTPRHRVEQTFIPLAHTDNFGYSSLYTLPNDLTDRYDGEPSLNYYFFNNGLQTETSNVLDPAARDVLRVSETQNLNEGARQLFAYSIGERGTSPPQPPTAPDQTSTQHTLVGSSEPSSRRSNFRRNNSSQRSRPSTSTTTSTEHASTESNKLSSRFRRRKGRPENRSINTARDENFIPLSEIESSTVTRHKNYDISHRGSAIVSDYLPVPEPLYRINQTSNIDQLNSANLNLEDLDAQILNPSTNSYYKSDDVSDLANSAVAAITNLKTMPPGLPAATYTKSITAAPSTRVTYPTEPKIEYHTSISTGRTTALPIYVPTISYRRGSTKVVGRTTTTTQAPSLQDIYNDYQEDLEYHAEPVDIPITGKVRIHGDGYIECLDMGNFPHPFSCRKFISCAKMEYGTLLGWEYTCPKGLSFDPIGGICNWAAGLGCKD